MISTFRFKINLMRFFRGSVIPKPLGFTLDGYGCSPFILKPDYTHETGLVPTIGLSDVLRISISANHSKVCKSIVGFIAVDVINQSVRPLLMNVVPSKSMGLVHTAFNAYRNVANSFLLASRNLPRFNRFASVNSPNKNPGLPVIIKDRAKMEPSEFGVHFNSPVMSMNINTLTTGAQA